MRARPFLAESTIQAQIPAPDNAYMRGFCGLAAPGFAEQQDRPAFKPGLGASGLWRDPLSRSLLGPALRTKRPLTREDSMSIIPSPERHEETRVSDLRHVAWRREVSHARASLRTCSHPEETPPGAGLLRSPGHPVRRAPAAGSSATAPDSGIGPRFFPRSPGEDHAGAARPAAWLRP